LRLRLLLVFVWTFTSAVASNAQQWERLGPEGGIVVSLGSGSHGPVYLGTADGHVFASDDDAASWRLRGRVGGRLDAVVTRLVVDNDDPNLVFAAVWYREAAENGGIYWSSDGGETWKPSGLEGEAVRALEAAPSNHLELIAGTRTGVFRSQDHGTTWQRISPEGDPELRNVDSIAIDPRDANIIYAGTYHLPWRTRDRGKTWEPIIAGIIDDSDIMSLRLDSTNPERLYMSACSGIYRSENQGAGWTKLQGIPYASRRTQTIVQDGHNPKIFYAGTTEGAWTTRDAGETWARTTPKDWVVNSIVVLPARFQHAGRVILGTESGVHISDDDGQTFTTSDAGFTHIVVKQLLADYQSGGRLLMLVQRNGWEVLQSTDEGRTWAGLPLATARPGQSSLIADQIDEVYASPWGWLVRMADGQFWLHNRKTGLWNHWKPRGTAEMVGSKSPSARKSSGQQTLLLQVGAAVTFGGNAAIVSTRQGLMLCGESGRCTPLGAFSASSHASLIWASRTSDEIAAVQDGRLGVSSDGGETASWKDLPVLAPQVLWLDQTPSSSQSKFVLGTTAGLFLSPDAGATWLAVRNGVPAGRIEAWLTTPAFCIVSERTGGLYLSLDHGGSWTRVDQDGERGRFSGLVQLGDRTVLVGSQGEGLLRLELVEDRK